MDRKKLFPVIMLAGLLILLLIATSQAGSVYVRCHLVQHAPNVYDTSWVPCIQLRQPVLASKIEAMRMIMYEAGTETCLVRLDGPEDVLSEILLDTDIRKILPSEINNEVRKILGRNRHTYR